LYVFQDSCCTVDKPIIAIHVISHHTTCPNSKEKKKMVVHRCFTRVFQLQLFIIASLKVFEPTPTIVLNHSATQDSPGVLAILYL
jgi:hypothetical protein